MHIFEKFESEVRSYCRRFPTIFDKARNSILVDTHGRVFIDFLNSAGAINYGHNNLEPRKLDYKLQFTGPTGTNVVESAVKLARKYTGRSNVVAFTNGFHGMSGTSLSLTGNRYNRQQYMAGNVTILPYERYMFDQLDSISYFRKLLNDNNTCFDLPDAVILETIQAEGGINIASIDWLEELRVLTKVFDILLIADDIQVG